MKQLRYFYQFVDCIAVSIGLIVCQLIENRLQHLANPIPVPVLFFLCLFVIIASLLLLSWLLKRLFVSSAILRKFILRNEYIEGVWFGDVGEHGIALTTILFDGSDITVTGEQYDQGATIIWVWNSLVTGFNERRLLYLSESRAHGSLDVAAVLGVTDITFVSTKAGKIPTSYVGYWSDLSSEVPRQQFQAERITDKRILKELSTLDGKASFIKRKTQQR